MRMIIPFAVSIESYDLFQKIHERITYYTFSHLKSWRRVSKLKSELW